MNRHDIECLREAHPILGRLLHHVSQCAQRTFPRVGVRGSQHEEDDILRDLLPEPSGTYVDIGAAEPIHCNNTWQFYQRGWRGLLVEPLFWFWPALLHERPGDYLYNAAIRAYQGITMLRVQGTVSSVLPAWNIEEQGQMFVPCDTATNVLNRFPGIRDSCQLCSIDVEGVEKEVLETIPWQTFRPKIFVVEYRAYDPEKSGEDISSEWSDVLEANNYELAHKTALNMIFRIKEPSDG